MPPIAAEEFHALMGNFHTRVNEKKNIFYTIIKSKYSRVGLSIETRKFSC